MWAVRWLLKPVIFIACLLPALHLIVGAFGLAGISLGADPVAVMLHTCGRWTLNFLMITLTMTPMRHLTRSLLWLRFRRMFGLFAFFYAVSHFLVYLLLDQAGNVGAVWQDIAKRPYITIGMVTLLMLIPLAATSTAKAQRWLGRRWISLHRVIYLIGILGVWHFWWQVKKDIREPFLYVCVIVILLGFRLWMQRRRFALALSRKPAELL